jgi:hypothetical protein
MMESEKLNHLNQSMTGESHKEEEKIEALRKAGLFELRGGSAVVHVDGDGNIRKVECHHITYLSTSKDLRRKTK